MTVAAVLRFEVRGGPGGTPEMKPGHCPSGHCASGHLSLTCLLSLDGINPIGTANPPPSASASQTGAALFNASGGDLGTDSTTDIARPSPGCFESSPGRSRKTGLDNFDTDQSVASCRPITWIDWRISFVSGGTDGSTRRAFLDFDCLVCDVVRCDGLGTICPLMHEERSSCRS